MDQHRVAVMSQESQESQESKVSPRDAMVICIFFGALMLAAMWFGRGFVVAGFIPAPLFAGALGGFFLVNVIRATRRG